MWTPVVGYEGLYEVSAEGMVWSCQTNKRIAPNPHEMVTLSREGRRTTHSVQRLVLEAFIETAGS